MKVDVRKLGIWMVVVGGAAVSVGIVADAVRQADDPTPATREGIFDLSGFPQALFFGGLCAVGLGLFALLFGNALYRPGAHVTVGRRLAQVGAPIAAVVLIAGCATVASNSSLSEPHSTAEATGTEARVARDGCASGDQHHGRDRRADLRQAPADRHVRARAVERVAEQQREQPEAGGAEPTEEQRLREARQVEDPLPGRGSGIVGLAHGIRDDADRHRRPADDDHPDPELAHVDLHQVPPGLHTSCKSVCGKSTSAFLILPG